MVNDNGESRSTVWIARRALISVVLLMIVSLSMSSVLAADWGFGDWQYRKEIVIDHTKVDSNLNDFPVLVDLTDSELAADAQADGDDILFTASDGTTKLAHEIESYDSGNLVAWVKTDLSSSSDTILYMYYGNPAASSQENPEAVWDSDYLSVQHFEETSGTVFDSTSNGNDGAVSGGVDQSAAGKIDNGYLFNGVDGRVILPQVYSAEPGFTFEAWVNTNDKQGYLVLQRDAYKIGPFIQFYNGDDSFQMYVDGAYVSVPSTTDAWHYVVGSFGSGIASLYVDDDAPASVSTTLSWPGLNTYFGDRVALNRALSGTLDEVRLSGVARSTGYVLTSYNNQNNPSSFYDVGTQEENSVLPPTNSQPGVTNEAPSDSATGVSLNPTLSADISDSDGDSVDWTVELYNGATWDVLNSGTEADGVVSVSASTTTVTAYNTVYQWRVTAKDPSGSGITTTEAYSFRTMADPSANSPPVIDAISPTDSAVGISRDPYLEARITDPEGDSFDWTVEFYSGGSWNVLNSGTLNKQGTWVYGLASDASSYNTVYQWRVTATDTGSGETTTETYSFRTRSSAMLSLKWTRSVPNDNKEIFPVMGDINNDGVQDVVFNSADQIYALNGKTGAIEWSAGGSHGKVPELVDINNDGIPEVLYAVSGPYVRALDGNGHTIWTSDRLSGNGFPITPIAAADVDGDGYPEIFVATEDTSPSPYDGNINDYNGAITKLDHNGHIMASSWLLHPCWGGISLADVNHDGKIEVYVGDRRDGSIGNLPATGVTGYDALTMNLLWMRKDIHSSSPIPVLSDVVGDSDLEVVAGMIVSNGPMVLNAMTGENILDYSNRHISQHGEGTVYDIDQDGDKEVLLSTGYPENNAPADFVVFDLVTGEVKFRPTFDIHEAWSPSVGDVDNDGNMEILATMGDQGSSRNSPLLIYDKNYNPIERIDLTIGEIISAKMFDVDGDGKYELVLAGHKGGIAVYDTNTPVPKPAPRTWVQRYNEQRENVPLYTPMPVGHA